MTMTEAPVAKNSLSSTAIVATVGVVLATGLFLRQRKKSKGAVAVNYPPNPEPVHWLWGNAPDMPRVSEGHHMDPKFLQWARELNRSVFNVKVPIVGNLMVIADPEWIHHISVTKNINKSWTYQGIAHIVGPKSIVCMKNHPSSQQWKVWRKTFTPGFMPTFLKTCVDTMCSKILDRYLPLLDQDAMKSKESMGIETNMMIHAQTFTSDVLVDIGFGEDWFPNGYGNGADNVHPCREWINQVSTLTIKIQNDPKTTLFGFKEKRLRKEYVEKVENAMNDILDRRLESYKNSGDAKTKKRDICSLAVESIMKEKGNDDGDKQDDVTLLSKHDRDFVVDQMKTFYFAGHDTTATTIAWAGWLLSQHPDVVTKLRDELAKAKIFVNLGSRVESISNYKNPTYEEIQNCEYLDAVVKETLRLYPPASSARYTPDLNETYKGYTIGGAVLYLDVYVMHRLSQYWGDDCDEFKPERFVGVDPATYAHKYLPFLKGPRDCLGKYFAYLEAKLAIAALVQRYDMSCVNPNETLGFSNTMHPYGGAKLRLKLA